MDLPDGQLRGKVGPWAHLMTLHSARLWCPSNWCAGRQQTCGATRESVFVKPTHLASSLFFLFFFKYDANIVEASDRLCSKMI